jgi:hypothetical protein
MSTKANHCVISSRDRQDPTNTTPQNFTATLQNPIYNSDSFTLINVMMPNVFYNITEARGNNRITIDNMLFVLSVGSYTLSAYLTVIYNLYSMIMPGFNISYDQISSKVTISATDDFTIEFDQHPKTAYTLGFKPLLYSGSNSYTAQSPTNMTALGINIMIDIVTNSTSLSTPNFRSSSFFINNNTNNQEFLQFFENSQYSHTVYTNTTFINSMNISLYDSDGYALENAGDWIMIIAFNHR